jgi:hypothetical protein
MIDRCFNPGCRRKLKYLRDGRVVRSMNPEGVDTVVEHFWLCGPCYGEFNFAFPPDGGVALMERKRRIEESIEFLPEAVPIEYVATMAEA